MYLENRKQKCAICKKAKPTCGDPKIYCKECADALLTGRVHQVGVGREIKITTSNLEHWGSRF